MLRRIQMMLIAVLVIFVFALTGCSQTANETPDSGDVETPTDESDETKSEEEAEQGSDEKPYIAVISKGFQLQFWQIVKQGTEAAAEELNVDVTFDGPSSEVDVSAQIDMLSNVISQNPAAIGFAALDAESAHTQLSEAMGKGIPVIGFDSGVPNAPEGSVLSTIATDSYKAAGLAAEKMFEDSKFNELLNAATADSPVVIACQNQDAISAAANLRTDGFIDRMKALCEEVFPGAVEVIGHENFVKEASEPVVVTIYAVIPPSTSTADSQIISQTTFQNTSNLIGYFGANEGSITGILSATNDGTDLDRESGKYKEVTVVGFDAGSVQKNAVREGYFLGSITQDPYNIGYLTVEMALKASKGESVDEVIDSGFFFYTKDNMDEEEIARLLYD